jgi:hypothetical protein
MNVSREVWTRMLRTIEAEIARISDVLSDWCWGESRLDSDMVDLYEGSGGHWFHWMESIY